MTKANVNQERELLFHYTKFDTALFHILPNKRLLLSPITNLNDINEVNSSFVESDWDVFDILKLSPNFDFMKKNKIKIASFVKDKKELRGFDNQMMWCFYGGEYKGVCLVFDKNKLISRFNKKFTDLGKTESVVYKLRKPKTIEEKEKVELEGSPGPNFGFSHHVYNRNADKLWDILLKKERYIDLFFRKNVQWSMENEYRFLTFDNNPPSIWNNETESLFLDFKDSLVGVMIGPNFNLEQESRRFEIVKDEGKIGGFEIYHSKYYGNKIVPLRTKYGPDYQKEVDYEKAFRNNEFV